jgi:hypothetical protein
VAGVKDDGSRPRAVLLAPGWALPERGRCCSSMEPSTSMADSKATDPAMDGFYRQIDAVN